MPEWTRAKLEEAIGLEPFVLRGASPFSGTYCQRGRERN